MLGSINANIKTSLVTNRRIIMGEQKRFHALDVLNEVKKHEEAKRIKKLQIKQRRALKEKQLKNEEDDVTAK